MFKHQENKCGRTFNCSLISALEDHEEPHFALGVKAGGRFAASAINKK